MIRWTNSGHAVWEIDATDLMAVGCALTRAEIERTTPMTARLHEEVVVALASGRTAAKQEERNE